MQDKQDTTAGGSSSSSAKRGRDGQASTASTGNDAFARGPSSARAPEGGTADSAGLTEHARSTLSNAATQAGDHVASRLDSEKNRAAEGLGNVAQALRQTSEQLRGQQQSSGAESYIASAADQVERFSGYLRSTNTRDMVHRIEQFAREQPAVFIGSAFMLGLIGARFLRSSARETSGQYGTVPRNQSIVPQGTYSGTAPYARDPMSGQGDTMKYSSASVGGSGDRGQEER
jgi:hypothetical protein